MSTRKIKKQVLDLLAGPDLETALSSLRKMEPKDVINALFSAIYRPEEPLRWYGITAMGEMVARLADKDMEEARIIMRRFLWSLNDESGGIGWGAPEAMAEVMSRHPGLAREYIHMLISYMREDGEEIAQDGNYLEHETLQRGLLWGIGRLAGTRPDMLLERGADHDLVHYLESPDAAVRGLAARALGLLGRADLATDRLRELARDPEPVRVYEDGRLRETTVAEQARGALEESPA